MLLEILIERWLAIGFVIFGVSHVLYPVRWAALFLPLRERETGALLLAMYYLPLGLIVVLGHNVWVWGVPLIVTLVGWVMTLKSVVYLLFPRALAVAMPDRMARAFRIVGVVAITLGIVVGYDSFFRN
jgi:hypothetical protein